MAASSPAQTPLKSIAGRFGHLKYSPRPARPSSPLGIATEVVAAGSGGDSSQRQFASPSMTDAKPIKGARAAADQIPFFATPAPGAVKVENTESPSKSSYFSPSAAASSSGRKRKATPTAFAKDEDEDQGGGGGFIPDLEPAPPKKVFAKYRPFASPEKYEHLPGTTDHISFENDCLLVGINPGVSSAAKGHHYAGPTNRFWPCVHQSGLVPEVVTYKDDARLPHDYNIGLTNLVSRPTTAASELSVAADMRPGVPLLLAKILRHRPQIVCFVGKDIWREFRFVLAAAERRKTGKSVKKEQAGWDEPRAWKVVHPQDGAGQVQATYFWAVSSTSGLCRDTMDQRRAAWGKLNDFKLELLRRRAANLDSVTATPIDDCDLGSLAVIDVEAVSEWAKDWQDKLSAKAAAGSDGGSGGEASGSEKTTTRR